MYSTLKNKVAIITGGASGIGEAAALLFAGHGASVVLADVQSKKGEEVVQKITSLDGKAIFVNCDMNNENDIQNLIQFTIKKFGTIDCAFNNAGIEGERSELINCTNENWNRVMDINLKSIWLCMKYQIPEFLKKGGGNIVNCSSIAGIVGFNGLAAYCASKHGIIGLTQVAALEYASKNIRVNAICPGVIHTPMVDRLTRNDPKEIEGLIAGEPIGRMGRAEEIAEAALWLCSDASSFVTGHPLVADGGWLAK